MKKMKHEIKEAKKWRLPWWGILSVAIGSLFCCWLFDHFGRFDLALPTMNSVGMLVFAIVLNWKLRRHVWFWITMTIIAALHVPLILFIPWTTNWVPVIAIGAIDSADLIVILAILSIAGEYMEGPKAAER